MIFVDKVFVYGTLKTDGPYFKVFSKHVLTVEPVYTHGTLYLYKEYFPAFSAEGETRIEGELMTLINTSAVFNILDTMETFYKRRLIDVFLLENDKKFRTWVYHVDPSLGQMEVLESGLWDNGLRFDINVTTDHE